MAGKKKTVRKVKRKAWSTADLKSLRDLAGKKSVAKIARVLKRTPAAVAYKAHVKQISLAMN